MNVQRNGVDSSDRETNETGETETDSSACGRQASSSAWTAEYFLPELKNAFRKIGQGALRSDEEVPIRLIMSTTLLNGNNRAFADDLGSLLPDVVHRGLFRFRRGAGAKDDFDDPEIIDRLALAARATASFPGAFEASYVPVGKGSGTSRRPAMDRSLTSK